ncbi:MAG: M20/M25/M40 family metallo-hydrolase, partial [Pseudomonadota bacterium]
GGLPPPPGAAGGPAPGAAGNRSAPGAVGPEDGAADVVGGDTGNLLARLPPTAEGGIPIFLCAHLDTVPPEAAIEPVVEDGVVRNAAGTILGADDKAAVAAMLVAAATILRESRPHAGVELLFTPKEEVGLLGALAFDHTRLHARLGYVYDQAAPVGQIVLGAPTQRSLHVRFHGRPAHAGMVPEEGRSAIAAAARAIAELRLGRLDDVTTANVGVISGGTARNIVPEWCAFDAEARSHDERRLGDLVQEMLDSITFAAQAADCEVETRIEESYRGYRFREDDLPVRLAAAALRRVGVEPSYALTGGGADANVFNANGLPCVNVANGMAEIHTPDEHVAVADIERMVEVTLALVEEARGAALA